MQQRSFAQRFLEHFDSIDLAEVKQFVQRTVRERDFIARIFETLIEGIVVLDGEFRVSMVNQAARRILQWPAPRKVMGESLLKVLASENPISSVVEQFQRDQHPVKDREVTLAPGTRRVYNVHLLPLVEDEEPGDDSRSRGAALIIQDITPARDKQARNAQAEKIASLATLTAGVAHEIKNPLNSLSIHAQLLRRAVTEGRAPSKRDAERIVQSCDAIAEEVERVRQCVDDFIEAARPTRVDMRLQDLNRMIEAVAATAALELEDKQIELQMLLDPDLPACLIDEKLMRSALVNLVRNAIEAIEAARRPPGERRIALRTSVIDEAVVIEVSDTGCGIPEEYLPRIFEPYFTTKFNGSGLGLMAVARIVREHNGRLNVRGAENEGATFAIALPLVSQRVRLLEDSKVPDDEFPPSPEEVRGEART